jgi:hypothetical protein
MICITIDIEVVSIFFFILHFYMYRGFRNDLYYNRYRGGVNLFSSSTFCIATGIEVL